MELVIFWVLCGIGAAVVASSKGHGGCAWFAIGVLLGPIGLLMAIGIAPAKPQVVEDPRGDMRKCPECAELIKAEARKCRYCGSEVEPLPQLVSPRLSDAPPSLPDDVPKVLFIFVAWVAVIALILWWAMTHNT